MSKFCAFLLMMMANILHPLAQEVGHNWPTIRFSGIDWLVKTHNEPMGPGDNLFGLHRRNAYVDKKGRLNLSIRQTKQGWSCAELVAQNLTANGLYTIEFNDNIHKLHPNMVLGFFVYNPNEPNGNNEVDIEFSKWGTDTLANSQFVVHQDNSFNRHRFTIAGKHSKTVCTIHLANNKVIFNCSQTHKDGPTTHETWESPRPQSLLSNSVQLRINLWWYGNSSPQGRLPKIRIDKITHTQ